MAKKATEPIKNGNPKKPGFSKKIQIKLEASIDSFQKSRSKTEIKAHSKQHFQRLPITFRKQQKESWISLETYLRPLFFVQIRCFGIKHHSVHRQISRMLDPVILLHFTLLFYKFKRETNVSFSNSTQTQLNSTTKRFIKTSNSSHGEIWWLLEWQINRYGFNGLSWIWEKR